MTDKEKDLRDDLMDAFDGDDPGAEFDQRVMADIEGGGGEHEISALDLAPRKSRRWMLVAGAAAAAILLAVYLGSRPGASGDGGSVASSGDTVLAAAPEAEGLELPVSLTTGDFKPEYRVYVTKDEKVVVHGEVLDWAELTRDLKTFLKDKQSAGPLKTYGNGVLICADRRVRWRTVQWVMQACANPQVRLWNLAFQVNAYDGVACFPMPLPRDRGLASRMETPPVARVALKRKRGEKQTRIGLLDSEIGVGGTGLAMLKHQFGQVRGSRPDVTCEISASASVPFAEVVRAADMVRQAGCETITFVGAPPPKPDLPMDEPFRAGDADLPTEEVIEEDILRDRGTEALSGEIELPIRLRVRDDKTELAPRVTDDYLPLDTALPKLIALVREWKAKRREVTGVVQAARDVPYADVQRVIAALKPEGVLDITLAPAVDRDPLEISKSVVVRVRLRVREGKPEIAPRHGDSFEPFSTGLPKLTKLLRGLKAEGHHITGYVYSGGVPDSVLQRVMKVYRKEGVTQITQRW